MISYYLLILPSTIPANMQKNLHHDNIMMQIFLFFDKVFLFFEHFAFFWGAIYLFYTKKLKLLFFVGRQRKYKLIAFSAHRHKAGRAALGLSCGACFEELACVFASSGALCEDITDATSQLLLNG